VHYWGKAFRDEVFGPEKALLLGRAQSCTEAGIRWTVHSDEPVSDMGPLRLMDNVVNRTMWKEPGSVLNPAERVSVEQAIISLTRDAAWQCHSEHEIGTLEVGKFADFVVLDKDPRAAPPAEIGKLKVLETWVDGRRVYAA
jgi:predicted amidohydrolase YtcJ